MPVTLRVSTDLAAMNLPRAILHVDMDAFYAAVEAHDRPELRGQPVVVGGLGPRSVVAAASYEVRRYGVHSAMPMSEALRRCPHAIQVRPRFARYQEISRTVFATFREFTPFIEGLSLDEAFLDVTHSQHAFGPALEIARKIQQNIRERTGLGASVGIAPNKLVAKIASDLRKPDGLVVISPEQVEEVLDPLPIAKLFGVGARTAAVLQDIGITTFAQLRAAADGQLQPIFGRSTALMRARAAGVDDRPVIADWDEKQISAESTFERDVTDQKTLHTHIVQLADRVSARMREQDWLAHTVVVKIRRYDFRTCTRQLPLRPASDDRTRIARVAAQLLAHWCKQNHQVPVRLLGVAARELTRAAQLELFTSAADARLRQLDSTIDTIRARFGSDALSRAAALRERRTRQ